MPRASKGQIKPPINTPEEDRALLKRRIQSQETLVDAIKRCLELYVTEGGGNPNDDYYKSCLDKIEKCEAFIENYTSSLTRVTSN